MDEQTAKALQEMESANKVDNKKEEYNADNKISEATQPRPEVMDYSAIYSFSDLFIEHLKISLRELPHYKAVQYINYAEQHKNGVSLVDLNGFIKKLDMLEYGYVNGLMSNIKNPEVQKQYFIQIKTNDNTNAQ